MSVYGPAVRSLLRRNRPTELSADAVDARAATVDREHLAAYNRVCGYRLADTLSPTYPHIMAFPLALRLMSAPDFPFPLIGLVHLANRITVVAPIPVSAALDLTVQAADLRAHDRGRVVDVIATATLDGALVWRGVSTYLHVTSRSGSSGSSGSSRSSSEAPPASAVWTVPARVGSDYARVSGDHNPIHTSRVGARVLGFKRPIAHGMWSKARGLAALEGRLPDAFTVDVAFKRPIFLPARVGFSATLGSGFALHDPKTGAPHLVAKFG